MNYVNIFLMSLPVAILLLFGIPYLKHQTTAHKLQLTVRRKASIATSAPFVSGLQSRRKVVVAVEGVITPDTTTRIVGACNEAERRGPGTVLEVRINSKGGDIHAAFEAADCLKRTSRRITVQSVVTGKCMSAAVLILMGVPTARRYAVSGCKLMIHAVRIDGSQKRSAYTRRIDQRYVREVAKGTRIKRSNLRQIFKTGVNRYIKGNEALALGFVACII